jgi:hypothetical protein
MAPDVRDGAARPPASGRSRSEGRLALGAAAPAWGRLALGAAAPVFGLFTLGAMAPDGFRLDARGAATCDRGEPTAGAADVPLGFAPRATELPRGDSLYVAPRLAQPRGDGRRVVTPRRPPLA